MSIELPVAPDTERLAGLVFELASQLHIERARRMALEAALVRGGIVAQATLDATADDAEFVRRSREALDESMAGLMRVLTEGPDPRTPLRAPADRN